MKLFRVVAPHFVAGFEVGANGVIYRCAPILRRRFRGLLGETALAVCEAQGWRVEEVASG